MRPAEAITVSRRRFISARYAGEAGNYSGLTIYELEYDWVPTEVGERVKAHLTGTQQVEEGRYVHKV